jgi:hypothetical protein
MKNGIVSLILRFLVFAGILVSAGTLVSCGSPLEEGSYALFPRNPPLQAGLLGEPHWRLEWYDAAGNIAYAELYGQDGAEMDIFLPWPSPVLAWPYWPEREIVPGLFYPAGGIYPFDVSGETLALSWEGGVEANFYRELALAQGTSGAKAERAPRYFDWPRFRTLLRESSAEELQGDPWLADWKGIAESTARSGFRRTLIKRESRTVTGVLIPHDGPWLGASPFREAENWEEGQEMLLALSSRPEIYVCPGGILSLSAAVRLWKPFP